jgi:hypothetical protein
MYLATTSSEIMTIAYFTVAKIQPCHTEEYGVHYGLK